MISLRTARNLMLLALFGLAGYLFAEWLSGSRDPTRLQVLCSHVDYLYENADEITKSKQWQRELAVLKEECDMMPGGFPVALHAVLLAGRAPGGDAPAVRMRLA
jgi:hypothetical protein